MGRGCWEQNMKNVWTCSLCELVAKSSAWLTELQQQCCCPARRAALTSPHPHARTQISLISCFSQVDHFLSHGLNLCNHLNCSHCSSSKLLLQFDAVQFSPKHCGSVQWSAVEGCSVSWLHCTSSLSLGQLSSAFYCLLQDAPPTPPGSQGPTVAGHQQ